VGSFGRFLHREARASKKPFFRPNSSGRSWRADARSGYATTRALIQNGLIIQRRAFARSRLLRCIACDTPIQGVALVSVMKVSVAGRPAKTIGTLA
jgi:hypothetical protein